MKNRFSQLTNFLQKKGGIEVLNKLPNVEGYVRGAGNVKNEFEDYIA